MKKIIIYFIALALCLFISACANEKKEEEGDFNILPATSELAPAD